METILAKGFTDWLLVACEGPWTALFGWDLDDGQATVVAREGGFRSVYLRDHPGEMIHFHVQNRDAARVVMANEDGGHWAFYERGAPLPFEDVERYAARRKRIA